MASPPASQPHSTAGTTESNLDTLQYDLYALIGGAPPIAFAKPTFQAKYNDKKRPSSWVNVPFTNPARDDDLVLNHWRKQDDASDEDYYFAKFNRVIDVPDYTDEEYEKYLAVPDWTKEETDYLFDLCRRFDLRFPVIEDRYTFGNVTRSMEDLKDRYYAVQRKLIRTRGNTPGEHPQERQALAQQYAFDKAKEVERKQILLNLFNRTKEEIEEEEALFIEARRIELNEPRMTREREYLLNSLQLEHAQQAPPTPITPTHSGANGASAGSSLVTPGGIGITGGTAGAVSTADNKKKKKLNPQEESSTAFKKSRSISNASSSILDDILPEKKEKMVQGVYVRSQKLPVITKQALQQKLLKTMADMDIGVRPNMPTAQVVEKYEQLHHSIVYLLELRKTVDKLEAEQKSRLQRAQQQSASSRDKRRK